MFYLNKIIDDLSFVLKNTNKNTKKDLEDNEILLDSIMFRIIQISENNKKLSSDFKYRNSNVPWAAINGMRNIIVYDYGNVSIEIIFDTVSNGIPYMCEQLVEGKNKE